MTNKHRYKVRWYEFCEEVNKWSKGIKSGGVTLLERVV